jgi:hypothetical protein
MIQIPLQLTAIINNLFDLPEVIYKMLILNKLLEAVEFSDIFGYEIPLLLL